MPTWVSSAIVYFAIVVFWMIVFFIAVTMTRRALHGVGEPLAAEKDDTQASNANGHIQSAETASTGTTPTGTAHG